MRKAKPVFACIFLLMSVFSPLAITTYADPVETPMQLTMLQDFSGYTIGQNLNTTEKVPISPSTATTATSTAVSTMGAPGSFSSVSMASEQVGGFATQTDLFYEVCYPQNTSLSSLQGIMVYIRLPKGRTGEHYSLFHFNLYTVKNNIPSWTHASNAPVKFLLKNSSEWESATASDGYLKLPYGFEGYIKLMFSDLPVDRQQVLSGAKIISSTFRFREISASRGPAILNAIYGIKSDSSSITCKINNDDPIYLTTGRKNDGSNTLALQSAMKAKELQSFNCFSTGDDIQSTGMFSSTKSNVTAFAVPGISGIEDGPAMEISSPTLSGFRDSDPHYEVLYSDNTRIDGMQALLFYVKAAGPHPEDNSVKIRFSLYTTSGTEANFTNLGNGTAWYLSKGSKSWVNVTAGDGILTLPVGFEGYIMADISELKYDPIAGKTNNRYAISSTFQFLALGGSAGSCTVDSIYIIKDKGTNPLFLSLNGCDVVDLSSGTSASPMWLTMLQDFSTYTNGQNLNESGKVSIYPPTATTAAATAVPTLGALGASNAIRMSSVETGGFATQTDLFYEMSYPQDTSLAKLQGVMLYIKLPKGLPDDRYSMFHFNLYTIKNNVQSWTHCSNTPIKVLGKGSMQWETVTANDGYIKLPYGFEGYVKLLFKDLPADRQEVLKDAKLISSTFRFREISAALGPAELNAVYGILSDSNTIHANLPSAGNNVYLTTGVKNDGFNTSAVSMAMKAKELQTFAGFSVGDNIKESGLFTSTKADVAAVAVNSPVNIIGNLALQISSPTLSGFLDTDPHYEVFYSDNTLIDGMESFLFYIKCPSPHPTENTSRIKFNLYTVQGSQSNFTNLGNGTAKYLRVGDSSWTSVTANNGILSLPAGFEGYIMADISELKYDPIAGDTANRRIISSTFQLSALGGEAGSCTIGSILMIRDKGTNPMIMTANGCDVYNLSTGMPVVSPTQLPLNRTFTPITNEGDKSMLKNPQRGFRLETFVNVANLAQDNQSIQNDPTDRLRDCYIQYQPESPQLAQVYFYLTGYKNTPVIPQYGIDRIQAYFNYARQLKVQLLVRFAYQSDMDGTGQASQTIMTGHMQQLRPILAANRDIIHVVQAGFLGAWGEWHSYTLPVDRVALIRSIVDMTPSGLSVQMRLPNYKNLIPNTDPIYNRLSFHNDSVFGEAAGGTGGVDPGTAQWLQFTRESPYQPVDGELFWGSWSLNLQGYTDGFLIDGYKVIKQLSEHHFTSLSVHHNYREDGPQYKYSMQYWQENRLTDSWLRQNNLFYAPGWFQDKTGAYVTRYVFDYVRDYLGYKLEAKSLSVTGNLTPNSPLSISLDLVNYGFSVPFNMESGFAILDKNNQVISITQAGIPKNWHSRNASDYSQYAQLTDTIISSINLPASSGKYRLAFYMKDTANNFARLGNQLPFVDGYSVIGEFSVN